MVGDFLEKAHKPQAEGGYWRLRLFSGNLPVPPSEDPFDHWLEQAWLMVEERDCTDKEKRHRLMESLKGPALEIAKSVRESDPRQVPLNTWRRWKAHLAVLSLGMISISLSA